MKIIIKIMDKIVDIGAIFTGVVILAVTLLVSAETVLRYFWNISFAGTNELTEYALLWLTLAGATWVLRQDMHLRIDVLSLFLNNRQKIRLEMLCNIVCIIVVLLVFFFGFREVMVEYVARGYMYSVLELPKALVMAIIPIGFFMLAYEFAKRIYRNVTELSAKPALQAKTAG